MSKHTPGPWEWTVRYEERAGVTIPVGFYIGYWPLPMAEIYAASGLGPSNGGDIDEVTANARLIAAAPQLVEALGSLLGWAVMRSDWAAEGKSEPTDHPIQRARAALKSAGVSHE